MRGSGSSIETSSKCWLALLGLVFLVSVLFLARSFMKVIFPPRENPVMVQQPQGEGAEKTYNKNELVWSSPQEPRGFEDHRSSTLASALVTNDVMAAKRIEAAREEMVRRQAQSLRTMVKENKLPDGLGHLTLDRIDEMEKKGIVIE